MRLPPWFPPSSPLGPRTSYRGVFSATVRSDHDAGLEARGPEDDSISPCSPNSVEEQVVHDRLEMSLHHCPRHALDGRRLPLGLLVLIDQQRAHALEEVVVGPHPMLRHAALDVHPILDRPLAPPLP